MYTQAYFHVCLTLQLLNAVFEGQGRGFLSRLSIWTQVFLLMALWDVFRCSLSSEHHPTITYETSSEASAEGHLSRSFEETGALPDGDT